MFIHTLLVRLEGFLLPVILSVLAPESLGKASLSWARPRSTWLGFSLDRGKIALTNGNHRGLSNDAEAAQVLPISK